jgi:hypothetical protein
MGCGCGRGLSSSRLNIIGYRVTLPDGTVLPPPGVAPYFSEAEARAEVRAAGGGTITAEVAS